MGFRNDIHYRLVVRVNHKPVNELLTTLFAEVPLDATCDVKIDIFGRTYLVTDIGLDPIAEPLGGTVSIEFAALFKYGWKSETLEAAKKFVHSNRYQSILVAFDVESPYGPPFGLCEWSTLAVCAPGASL